MHRAAAIDDRLLPYGIRRLVRAIGLPLTMALLNARGGTRLCIGKRAADADLLIGIIGEQAVARLFAEYAGAPDVQLPMPDKLLIPARNRAIIQEHAEGDSLMVLALRYRLTVRHILNVLQGQKQAQVDTAQADLFADGP